MAKPWTQTEAERQNAPAAAVQNAKERPSGRVDKNVMKRRVVIQRVVYQAREVTLATRATVSIEKRTSLHPLFNELTS